jgi:hypothetical protein
LLYTAVAVLIILSTSLVVRVLFAVLFWGLRVMVVPDWWWFRLCQATRLWGLMSHGILGAGNLEFWRIGAFDFDRHYVMTSK